MSCSLRGRLSPIVPLSGALSLPSGDRPPTYVGSYEVTPLAEARTTLQTAGKFMERNVLVYEIPYAETSNPSGGLTVTIGG